MANGKITTGFSKPYVALYSENGGNVTYSGGMALARGVDVSVQPGDSSDDNTFYADNSAAESVAGKFTGGTLSLTIDGLLPAAERFIYGLPAADSEGWTGFGDDMVVPYVGVGYIARQQSDGVVTYVPTIICKCQFDLKEETAKTQEAEIDWQTESLTAKISVSDDANHNWKFKGKEYSSEAAAEAALKAKLSIA